jgi:hypothetical protein
MYLDMAETSDFPIPPASFSFLVESMLMQTQVHLGLLHFREQEGDEEPEPNLPLARHSIDMLGMLQEKTKGNLTQEEQRLIENGLTELRFRYIQVFEAQKKKNEPKQEEPRIIVSDGGKGTKSE